MADMDVRVLVVGSFGANCYLVMSGEGREALLIDPGADAPRIVGLIQAEGARVKYIVNTHGHVDHIGANAAVKQATGAELLIGEEDAGRLTNPAASLSLLSPEPAPPARPDRTLAEGDEVACGELTFKVLHTPGHTPGGICLYSEEQGVVFTGDTLFQAGIGRTDFPGGSYETLLQSIREKLFTLPDDTQVLPGHGPASTIGDERAGNPFVRGG